MKPQIIFSVKKKYQPQFLKNQKSLLYKLSVIAIWTTCISGIFDFGQIEDVVFFLQSNIFPFISPPSRIFHSWNQIMSYKSGNFTSDRFPKLFPPPGLKDKWLTSHLCFEDFPHKACISQNRQYAWNVWNGMLKSSTFLKNMVSHQNFVFIFVFLDSSWNFSLEKWYNTCI